MVRIFQCFNGLLLCQRVYVVWIFYLIEYVYDVLKSGTEVARAKAREVLARVKRNMKIEYFESDEFRQEIVDKYQEK